MLAVHGFKSTLTCQLRVKFLSQLSPKVNILSGGYVTKISGLFPNTYRMFCDFIYFEIYFILVGTVPTNIYLYIYIYIYIYIYKNLIVLERERERERERVTLHEVVNLRIADRCQLRIYVNLKDEIFLLNS